MRLRRLRRLQSTRIDLERRPRKTASTAVCAQPNAHQRAVQVNEGGDEGIIPNGQRGQSTEDLPALRLNRLVGGMLSVEELRVGERKATAERIATGIHLEAGSSPLKDTKNAQGRCSRQAWQSKMTKMETMGCAKD